jgi:hypothetical protein
MARIYISHRTQETKKMDDDTWQWEECEEEKCLQCGKMHDSLWIIHRVLADTFGHFACFRINGDVHVIDASLPHRVEKIPRKAVRVGPEDFARLWHMNTGSHVFGS